MVTNFSPATTPVRSILQAKQNPPKAFLSIRDSYGGAMVWKKSQRSTVNVYLLSSAASFVTPQRGAAKFSGNPIVVKKQILQKRAGTVRAATMEEIEAEKSSIEKDAKGRMEKTIEATRSYFNSIRTGRASPAMLDKIEVDYYGSPVGLKSLAQISSPDATSLLISPYDKSSLKSIEKAIVASDLGLTPNNDGEVIRLTLPQLSSDRRKELTKVVSKQAEEGKMPQIDMLCSSSQSRLHASQLFSLSVVHGVVSSLDYFEIITEHLMYSEICIYQPLGMHAFIPQG